MDVYNFDGRVGRAHRNAESYRSLGNLCCLAGLMIKLLFFLNAIAVFMIRINDIRLPFDHTSDALKEAAASTLNIPVSDIIDLVIFKRSIDARRKNNILAVYTLDVGVVSESEILNKHSSNNKISQTPDTEYIPPVVSNRSTTRPLVVGAGPSGLFAGLILAEAGLKPILIDRGKDVTSRIKDVNAFWQTGTLNPESNVQFGEGGAGTFSDGKLTTQIKDKNNRVRKILTEFVNAGSPEEILYQSKPHIGTDHLVKVVKNLRQKIVDLGGDVRFETKLTNLQITSGKVSAAIVNDNELIQTENIILALGHSARDTFQMLKDSGLKMQPKPFSIGVRIEHPQLLIDRAQYGKFAERKALGPADYKLVVHCNNGRSAYTFCMCPGGEVIACASEQGRLVVNGMSRYKRNSPNANSALLVGITPEDFDSDDVLAGIEFQRKWEQKAFELGGSDYTAPAQLVGDFLEDKQSQTFGQINPTYKPSVNLCDISECLPEFVTETIRLAIPQMDKKLKGFAMPDAVMTAIETRSSCPVRMLRDDNFQSVSIDGLYPAGEGAGYAGGIMSAAVDGIKTAEAICTKE